MPKPDAGNSESKGGCPKCHREPFQRMLHLLRNFPDERAAMGHLKQEFDDFAFIASEISWRSLIFANYSKQLDEWGKPIPVWLVFAKSRCVVTKTPTGYHMKPKWKGSEDMTMEEWDATKDERYAASKTMRETIEKTQREKRGFAEFDRQYIIKELPCLGCGEVFKLPFAHGDEQVVLCETCNQAEAKRKPNP